jgi:hypothetical protein
MGIPFASHEDVEYRWRPLTPAEQDIADVLAEDASAVIRARFPGIDAQITSGAVDADVVTLVAAGMVKRAMIAPDDGVAQQSEGMGPYSQSRTFANPMRNVFLTAADLVLILGYQPSGQSHGFSNTTTASCGYGRIYGW